MDDLAERDLEAIAKAIADPVRNRIFNAVAEASLEGGPGTGPPTGITVRQLSEQIHESRRRVRHHLGVLREQGLIDAVKEGRRGGVVEHHYAATRMPRLEREAVAGLSVPHRQRIFMGCLRLIIASAAAALDSGTAVKRPEWAAIRIPVEVDRQGWEEIADLHVRFLEEVEELGAEGRARLDESGEKPIKAISATLFFEAAP